MLAQLATLVLLVQAAAVAAQFSYSKSIVYESADLTMLINTPDGSFAEIEAFKAASNDRILDNRITDKYAQLSWYSVGLPTLVATAGANNSRKLIHSRKSGFFTFVQTLVPVQRRALAQSLTQKYKVSVDASQIFALPLNKFECVVSLYDYDSRQRVAIRGSARNFQPVNLRVDFHAPVGSKERKLFEAELASGDSIDVYCTAASASSNGQASNTKLTYNNKLGFTPRQVESLRVVDTLFYPRSFDFDTAESVYVTRPQLRQLASDLYARDNFNMSEGKFKETFVDDFVGLVGVGEAGFMVEPFDATTVGKLSRYVVLTPDGDRPESGAAEDWLEFDSVAEELSGLFYVTNLDNQSVISVSRNNSWAQIFTSGADRNVMGSRLTVFTLDLSVEAVFNSRQSWSSGRKSLDEQLRALNADSERVIVWNFDRARSRLLPKGIRVAEVSRASLSSWRSTSIIFSHARRPSSNPNPNNSKFEKSFVLYAEKPLNTTEARAAIETELQDVQTRLSDMRVTLDASIGTMGRLEGSLNRTIELLDSKVESLANNLTAQHQAIAILRSKEPVKWFKNDLESSMGFTFAKQDTRITRCCTGNAHKVAFINPKLINQANNSVKFVVRSTSGSVESVYAGVLTNGTYDGWPGQSFNCMAISSGQISHYTINGQQLQAGVSLGSASVLTITMVADFSAPTPTLQFQTTGSAGTLQSATYNLRLNATQIEKLHFAVSVYVVGTTVEIASE